MISKLTKLFAYKKAPKSTFALLHPRKALKWGAVLFLAKKLLGGRQERRA